MTLLEELHRELGVIRALVEGQPAVLREIQERQDALAAWYDRLLREERE